LLGVFFLTDAIVSNKSIVRLILGILVVAINGWLLAKVMWLALKKCRTVDQVDQKEKGTS
jgi:cytochrome c biogenesis protein CcdA